MLSGDLPWTPPRATSVDNPATAVPVRLLEPPEGGPVQFKLAPSLTGHLLRSSIRSQNANQLYSTRLSGHWRALEDQREQRSRDADRTRAAVDLECARVGAGLSGGRRSGERIELEFERRAKRREQQRSDAVQAVKTQIEAARQAGTVGRPLAEG